MKKFLNFIPAVVLFLGSMVTFGTDGSFSVTSGDLAPSVEVITNGASSIWTLFLQILPTLFRWGIPVAIVLFVLGWFIRHKKS